VQPEPVSVEAIERASIAAVTPKRVEELRGWLLAFDNGSVNRAKSAVPLQHAALDPGVVPEIITRYLASATAPQFRLADLPPLAAVQDALCARGFAASQPTVVQLAAAGQIPRASREIRLRERADEAWVDVFRSDGAPASRAAMLERAPDTVYASVRERGQTVAVGALTFGFGLASVQGMRTLRECRGRGLAGQVLGALAEAALRRGVGWVFLQVEEENRAALRCYERAGFAPGWAYRYWRAE
jgi:ribosomal protein S18 acetylase RimI-like enzyme